MFQEFRIYTNSITDLFPIWVHKTTFLMKHNKCGHCFQRRMLDVCRGTQSCKTLYINTLTDFPQAFQNDITTYKLDAVNEIGPLVSRVILSDSTKSHDFFDAHGGIYSVNVFPL